MCKGEPADFYNMNKESKAIGREVALLKLLMYECNNGARGGSQS